jgi:hypothetical protein
VGPGKEKEKILPVPARIKFCHFPNWIDSHVFSHESSLVGGKATRLVNDTRTNKK